MNRICVTGTILVLCVFAPQGADGSWRSQSRGETSLSSRVFLPDNDKGTDDYGLSLEAELEVRGKAGGFRTEGEVFARAAAIDSDRSLIFLKDAWVGYRDAWVDIRLGTRVLNWSATEAFHPSDNLNSRNLDSDIENAAKVGEPMFSFRLRLGEGGVTGYLMPMRLGSRLPGPRSRLNLFRSRVPDGMELSDPVWIDSDGQKGDRWFSPQFAVRADQTIGSFDGAIYYVNHNDRIPSSVVLDGVKLRPVYAHIQRYGGTTTLALGEWLIKGEAEYRAYTPLELPVSLPVLNPLPVDHTLVALGLEWGWTYDEAEGTVILEGQGAIAQGLSEEERQALGPFQHDVLVAYRHTFNNTASTEVRLGAIVDVMEPSEVLGNLLFTHRINDYWSVESSGRLLFASNRESILNGFDEAHSVELSMKRYF